ncbi:PREDICTED: SUMO-activating enzyme subunit 1 [Polistes dominula]|uniref:SUMO-activating enzyme subunit 1 n=1 Tax=Polistes dominula TaxID=743375 RepID=A0ABM1IRZ4_POLDO|nr:PREDICTED: SUMO-activating enzyme subunit 1 [Polistes dominula]
MTENKNNVIELTDAEAELYDRQIRLWGVESQRRLRTAKVLIIGMNGFGSEVAKNIILVGVKTVTLLDHRNMTVEDTCSQFFLPHNQIGKNRAEVSLQRAQNLNPMVAVEADTANVDDKPDEFFSNFNVICAIQCTITQLKRINKICREHNIKFFAGDVWGSFGYTFADLMEHEYIEDVVQTKTIPVTGDNSSKNRVEKIVVAEKRKDTFVSFETIVDLDKSRVPTKNAVMYYGLMTMLHYREKHNRDPLPSERNSEKFQEEIKTIADKYELEDVVKYLSEENLYAQISPVCAIIGGVMSQEIIKAVSRKEAPHNNMFLFSPTTMCGQILKLV